MHQVDEERVHNWATPQPPDTFSTRQLCAITGLTFRQLDYWARTKLLSPSVAEARGSGTARLYSLDDVRRARVLSKLIDAGVSLQRARAALPLLHSDDGCRWLVIGAQAVLCSDGELERIVDEVGVCTVIDLGGPTTNS